jgi:hypothetical protein
MKTHQNPVCNDVTFLVRQKADLCFLQYVFEAVDTQRLRRRYTAFPVFHQSYSSQNPICVHYARTHKKNPLGAIVIYDIFVILLCRWLQKPDGCFWQRHQNRYRHDYYYSAGTYHTL